MEKTRGDPDATMSVAKSRTSSTQVRFSRPPRWRSQLLRIEMSGEYSYGLARGPKMISLPVPVAILDAGEFGPDTKRWWKSMRRAQLAEIRETFGDTTPISSLSQIEALPVPGVLVVPALAGGCVTKRKWWAFLGALQRYRRRGGLVLVLLGAFCLPDTGQRAGGRQFAGVQTSGVATWLEHPVHFTGIEGPVSPAGFGFCPEHAISKKDGRIDVLESAKSGSAVEPLVIRFADDPRDSPGAMLFLNTWTWMRVKVTEQPKSEWAKVDRSAVNRMFESLRDTNRRAVTKTLSWILDRMAGRLLRLEGISGEGERLTRNMGAEKDYHRLLANDSELALDLMTYRGLTGAEDKVWARLRTLFSGGWIWAEPPHHKQQEARGRLDMLLFAEDEGPDDYTLRALEEWLATSDRSPVAWFELEAGPFHEHQMNTFLGANGHMFRAGDLVVAVDRSRDDDPSVTTFEAKVNALKLRFIHVQIPSALDRLEEYYAPMIHRSQRKRFTVEIMRGLIG